jgi:hypothetical protein
MRVSTYIMVGAALMAMAMLYPNWTNAAATTGVNPQVISLAVDNSSGTVPASLIHWRGGWRGGYSWGGYYPYRSFYYTPYSYRHFYRPYGYSYSYPYSYYTYYPSRYRYVY